MRVSFVKLCVTDSNRENLPQIYHKRFPGEDHLPGKKEGRRACAPRPFADGSETKSSSPCEGELLDPLSETMPYPFEMLLVELELIPVWALHIRKGNRWVTVVDVRMLHAECIVGNPFWICLASIRMLIQAVHACDT